MAEHSLLHIRNRAIQKARGNYNHYAEFALRNNLGDHIRQGVLHRIWQVHIQHCWKHGYDPAILAPFAHGKCQPKGSLVQMADGSRVPIERINGEQVIGFDEEEYSFSPSSARSFPNGVKRVLRLNLWSGRSVEVTENHPLLTADGWSPATKLEVGDHVAVSRKIPDVGRTRLREGEARLIGYFIGDGGTTTRPIFTVADEVIEQSFCETARGLGFDPNSHCYQKTAKTVYVKGARKWLRSIGLLGCNSHTKRIPESIFKAPLDQVSECLAAYFECDGNVSTQRTGSAEYYSVNRDLLSDVQSLLLRFSIRSQLRRKRGRYNGEVHESWRLTITGSDNLELFRDQIPVIGSKREKLKSIQLVKANANDDGVPLVYREYLYQTPYWHKRNTGVSLDQMSKRTTNRETVRKAALAEGNKYLMNLVSDWVSWDRIVSIEDMGELETFGLEVDRLHTYITNDVIVHNTIQLVVGFPTFLLGQDPNQRIKVICQNDVRAMERVMGISAIIRSAPYQVLFPNVREVPRELARKKGLQSKWTSHEIFLHREGFAIDPSVQAAGVLSGGTGGRCDLLIFDDVVDQKNAIDQPELRQKVIDNVDNVWSQRLEPTGRKLFVGTPWHQADLTHKLMERPSWSVLRNWISEDFKRIEMEVYNPPPGYPIPVLQE